MKLNYWNPQVHEKLDKLADVFGVTTDIEIHKFMRNLTFLLYNISEVRWIEIHKFMRNLTGQGIYERKRQYIEIHKFMRNLTLSNILPTSAPLLKSTSSWETWLSILKFRVFPSNWNPQVHEKLDGDSKEVAQALEIEIHKFMRNLTAKILFTC